jgi:hypothetical protein
MQGTPGPSCSGGQQEGVSIFLREVVLLFLAGKETRSRPSPREKDG